METIPKGNHVKFIQQLEIRIDFLTILDKRLQIFISSLVELLRLERKLRISRKDEEADS